MDWLERARRKLAEGLFEPSIPPPPEDRIEPNEEPLLLLEQTESSVINVDASSAAQQLLEEELSRVISADAEDTIFRVEACIQFVGDFAQPETVCKMLQNVAGKDPAVLAEDGRLRIATIEKLIQDTASQATAIMQETSGEAESIKAERERMASIYANSCEAAHRDYDEKLKALQAELEEELRSIKEQNDSSMADLEERSRRNAQKREDVQNLSRAVDAQGHSMIERISKLLALITPSNKPDSN